MSILQHTPRFTVEEAASHAEKFYGIESAVASLPSERDQNFLLRDPSGKKYVLKISNAGEDRALIEAQNQVLRHLAQSTSLCQTLVPAKDGSLITIVESPEAVSHLARLVTWLEGEPLGTIRHHSSDLLADLGRSIGRLDRLLESFDHPALHREFYWDLARALQEVRQCEEFVADLEMRKVIDACAASYERAVLPFLPRLRRSTIYNDANDYNVLVDCGGGIADRYRKVSGLLDLGDMVYSHTINDLAIAIAYAILEKTDPLEAASHIVKGYHSEYALTEDEVAVLWDLVRMRLCMSVCIAAYQQRECPDNEYLIQSQRPIRNTLPLLAAIHPRFAEALFRHACGFPPPAICETVLTWLRGKNFASLLDIPIESLAMLDLGISSPLISLEPGQKKEPALTARLVAALAPAGALAGIGSYGEPRLHEAGLESPCGAADHETIHLGIDLFAEAGSPLHAPLGGTIHAAYAGSPGPACIILKHCRDGGQRFYTLYSHLSRTSIKNAAAGKAVAQGEPFATIGAPEENGGYPPHVHMQLIIDLLERDCRFPSYCRASQFHIWHGFSSDPAVILGIPPHCHPAKSPDISETLATRRRRLGQNLSIAYHEPLKIVRGWKQYLYDEKGRRYLDAYNNVPHIGHCHPSVIGAAREQMGVLNTNTRYLHDLINRYAEAICATLPDALEVCYFVNSGSEANELALRLARAHTGEQNMIVLEGAYHGNTTSLIDISPYKHNGPGGRGAPPWVHTASLPCGYRGRYKSADPSAASQYADEAATIIQNLKDNNRGLAGFIAETCPSSAGQIILPDGYLTRVYDSVRTAGGVCIADEVQTGYGRMGSHFYAFQMQHVVPDVVVLGKPIGNGHPIGAVITTKQIASSFNNGMEYFNTFGGNTVSCAIGIAVLEVVQREGLQSNALHVGTIMREGLRALKDRHPMVGDVRGRGFFLGIELVRDRQTLEPAAEEASHIVNRMRECGILLGTEGPRHNVIKIRPPMPFSGADAGFLLSSLDRVLAETH